MDKNWENLSYGENLANSINHRINNGEISLKSWAITRHSNYWVGS